MQPDIRFSFCLLKWKTRHKEAIFPLFFHTNFYQDESLWIIFKLPRWCQRDLKSILKIQSWIISHKSENCKPKQFIYSSSSQQNRKKNHTCKLSTTFLPQLYIRQYVYSIYWDSLITYSQTLIFKNTVNGVSSY